MFQYSDMNLTNNTTNRQKLKPRPLLRPIQKKDQYQDKDLSKVQTLHQEKIYSEQRCLICIPLRPGRPLKTRQH